MSIMLARTVPFQPEITASKVHWPRIGIVLPLGNCTSRAFDLSNLRLLRRAQSWQVTYLTPVLAYENWVGRSGDGRLLVAVIRLMIPALHTLKKVATRPDRVDN